MTRFEGSARAIPEEISALTEAVMTFLQEQDVEPRAVHHVGLVLDEVLTNLGIHGNWRSEPARVRVGIEADRVTGEIIDRGPPFDPRLAPAPAFKLAAEDRPVGGLGLYLVRKLSCALEYMREGGENRTIFAIARRDN